MTGDTCLTQAAAAADDLAAALVRLVETVGGGRTAQGEAWRLLDVQEAAARLGRSERWLRERVRRREITVVRLDGGALAFDLDDLRAFAHDRRIEARP